MPAKFYGYQTGDPILGDLCHQQVSGQTAGCCICDTNNQILIRNIESNTNYSWRVQSARTINTRFWNVSTATVTLACPDTLNKTLPPLPIPTNRLYRKGFTKNDLPLSCKDEIVIYMGWLPGIRPIVLNDLGSYLLPVFTGVIDVITQNTTANGTNVQIQCRGRLAYLMDSIGSFNSADFATQQTVGDLGTPEENEIKRSDVIRNIARQSIGNLGKAKSIEGTPACYAVGGIEIKDGHTIDPTDSDANAYSPYIPTSPMFIGGKTRIDPKSITTLEDWKFNVITGRLPYNSQEYSTALSLATQQANFSFTDRIPIEVIKYLSLQEPWVTELFSDDRTGELWYAPRGLDVSGLKDPKRLYRTYFVETYPNKITYDGHIMYAPHQAQMSMAYKDQETTLGFRSNIVAASSSDNSTSSEVVHLRVNPPFLQNRLLPSSYYYIVDPSAAPESGELAITALKYARYVSQSLRAGSLTVTLDPSLTPGEAVQVVGKIMGHPELTSDSMVNDRKTAIDLKDRYQQFAKDVLEFVKNKSQIEDNVVNINTPFTDGKQSIQANTNATAAEDMCTALFGDGNDLKIKAEPKSIWRIEGVVHNFNSGASGFTSEIQLGNAF